MGASEVDAPAPTLSSTHPHIRRSIHMMTTTDATPDITGDDAPTPAPIPVFDKEPAKGTKPKYFVAGTTFYAQMDGWELKVPVKLSGRTVKTLRDTVGDEDEFDQLVQLFGILGDEHTVERLLDEDFLDATEAAIMFFRAWQEKNEARLGELSRSSI